MKSPAFQFYAKDWLSSKPVRLLMDAEQRGWYIQLMAEAWENAPQAGVPNDPEQLWKMAGAKDEQTFNARSKLVLEQFEERKGVLFHPRLVAELRKQKNHRRNASNAGKKSAEKRQKRDLNPNGRSISVEAPLDSGSIPVQRESNIASASSSASAFAFAAAAIKEAPTLESCRAFAPTIGMPEAEGEAYFRKYQGVGWVTNAGLPISDWKSFMHTWKSTFENKIRNGFKSSQDASGPSINSIAQADSVLKELDASIKAINNDSASWSYISNEGEMPRKELKPEAKSKLKPLQDRVMEIRNLKKGLI